MPVSQKRKKNTVAFSPFLHNTGIYKHPGTKHIKIKNIEKIQQGHL